MSGSVSTTDVAAALLDDSVYRGQAEPGSLARCFRCVERFEQVAAYFFGHAGAGVGDRQLDEVSGGNRRRLDTPAAAPDVRTWKRSRFHRCGIASRAFTTRFRMI